ncbi:methylated-DNA--[protein]-cysteine S-methyltransferase [Sphaerisporangium sp. TRM90804]|uniref:methylated-DNA--[protein]-cysteine S-methyltransferase n=1 Tax=Sphaerisporangium sp. TRM90804 TaxID=3031113 RepID=UPI00244C4C37|nr:methylated-DNA--[protein]-cysteine S-methyltransferase [Sphaerisporangium sp. TRM90804]MDH2425139.1 methylated-DNA--[protein]-cysteine S-methyltransferase [Sphaerisporangium sp. TRM90804]
MVDVAFGSVLTPLGRFVAAVTPDGVAATDFRDAPATRRRMLARLGAGAGEAGADAGAWAGRVEEELAAYFAGRLRAFTVPVDWRLFTPAQRRVLGTLYETVRYGRVTTYGGLAAESGAGLPARAIGSIMGGNPVPVIVPCHRVVAGDGLGGFSGGDGVESKRWLLTLEGYLPPTLDWELP